MRIETPSDDLVFGLTLSKSREADEKRWFVQGIASVEQDGDFDGEKVMQKGMDFSPLLTFGHINWDHQKGPEFIIGEPSEASIVRAGDYAEQLGKSVAGPAMFVRGELYPDNKHAQAVWEYLNAQARGERRRRLGWSVQGRVLERDNATKRIVKSQVLHLAITHQPVNTLTFADLVKSMTTASAAPLLRENLHRNRITLDPDLYGECVNGRCYKANGGFYKGPHGALDHLVKCRGYDINKSQSKVATLSKRGFHFY